MSADDTVTKETKMTKAIDLIAAERARQITEEGYTPEHDAGHDGGALMQAADCYLHAAQIASRSEKSLEVVAEVLRSAGIDPESDEHYLRQRENPTRNYYGWYSAPHGWRTWPWDIESWKPSPDPVRNLVKAGALIAAEIDRLLAKEGA